MAVLRVMDLVEPLWPLTLAAGLPVRGAVITVLGHALFSPVASLQATVTAGCIAQARTSSNKVVRCLRCLRCSLLTALALLWLQTRSVRASIWCPKSTHSLPRCTLRSLLSCRP